MPVISQGNTRINSISAPDKLIPGIENPQINIRYDGIGVIIVLMLRTLAFVSMKVQYRTPAICNSTFVPDKVTRESIPEIKRLTIDIINRILI